MNEEKIIHFTVGELIEILRSLPPEMPILTSGYENGFENIEQPVLMNLIHKPDNPYYDGEFQPAGNGEKGVFNSVVLPRVVREV